MGLITDLARQGKDRMVARAIESMGETIMGRYGRLVGVRLDSLDRRLELEVLLKGEQDTVILVVRDYRFDSDEGRSFLTIGEVSASREWMEILAGDFLKGRKFEIPSKYAAVLNAVL